MSHFITTGDFSAKELLDFVHDSTTFKYNAKCGNRPTSQPLVGKTLALMFSKRSTRTRVATETAVNYLGGHPMFLGSQDIQLGVNESLLDTSIVVSSMVDGIMARVGKHEDIETIAEKSSVPVINALSDKYHPTQILADLMTIHEYIHDSHENNDSTTYSAHTQHPRETLPGLKVAWVGDANNILQEILVAFPKVGISVSAACPVGYNCLDDVVETAHKDAAKTGATVVFTTKPEEAIKGADFIITDTWVSMGQEDEKKKRLEEFKGYQITMDLVARGEAKPTWRFMHCLPRKPEEVDDEVFYSNRSLVFEEAENRKWTIMAVVDHFMGEKKQ